MTGSVVCKKVSFQHFILLTGLCWSQKENEAQDGMWKGVLERKWLALSGFSYILQTHTRADTHTLWRYIISLPCILPPGWTSYSPFPTQPAWSLPVGQSSLWQKLAFIRAPSSCCMWPCVLEHHPLAETAKYPLCSTGIPLGGRACSVKMTRPYVCTLHLPATERFFITSSAVWQRESHSADCVRGCLRDSLHSGTLST